MRQILLLSLVLTVTACGFKGALFLPKDSNTPQVSAPNTIETTSDTQ